MKEHCLGFPIAYIGTSSVSLTTFPPNLYLSFVTVGGPPKGPKLFLFNGKDQNMSNSYPSFVVRKKRSPKFFWSKSSCKVVVVQKAQGKESWLYMKLLSSKSAEEFIDFFCVKLAIGDSTHVDL